MNEKIIHWNQISCNGSDINQDIVLKTLLFADGQVLGQTQEIISREHYITGTTI